MQESGFAISDGATPGIEVIVADIVFVLGYLMSKVTALVWRVV